MTAALGAVWYYDVNVSTLALECFLRSGGGSAARRHQQILHVRTSASYQALRIKQSSFAAVQQTSYQVQQYRYTSYIRRKQKRTTHTSHFRDQTVVTRLYIQVPGKPDGRGYDTAAAVFNTKYYIFWCLSYAHTHHIHTYIGLVVRGGNKKRAGIAGDPSLLSYFLFSPQSNPFFLLSFSAPAKYEIWNTAVKLQQNRVRYELRVQSNDTGAAACTIYDIPVCTAELRNATAAAYTATAVALYITTLNSSKAADQSIMMMWYIWYTIILRMFISDVCRVSNTAVLNILLYILNIYLQLRWCVVTNNE